MHRFARRLVTIPGVVVLAVVMVVGAPLWLVIGTGVDLATKRPRLPSVRLAAYATFVLLIEVLVAAVALGLWIVSLGGHRNLRSVYSSVETWWVRSLFCAARPLLGVRLNIDEPPDWPKGNVVVLSRHTNLADAVLPANLLLSVVGRPVQYVVKRELRWLPSIDVYGQWLGNFQVSRGADTKRDLDGIAALGRTAVPDACLVIFPEGTYATKARKSRVVASLRTAGKEDLARYAEHLRWLLPPKPAGTVALLESSPDAPVVILGHSGLDGLSEPGGLRRMIPLEREVHVSWWLHGRGEIDSHHGGPVGWLQDAWRTVDEWAEHENQ